MSEAFWAGGPNRGRVPRSSPRVLGFAINERDDCMKPRTVTAYLAQVCSIAAVIAATGLQAAAQTNTEVRFPPDVIGQFDALTVRPDPMGWDIGKYKQERDDARPVPLPAL